MKKITVLLISMLALSGCSLLSPTVNQFEETAATAVVESSERTLCRNIPVGTWMRMYGSNAERMHAWQLLCTNKAVTPATVNP
jgi:hypothetical protein